MYEGEKERVLPGLFSLLIRWLTRAYILMANSITFDTHCCLRCCNIREAVNSIKNSYFSNIQQRRRDF